MESFELWVWNFFLKILEFYNCLDVPLDYYTKQNGKLSYHFLFELLNNNNKNKNKFLSAKL